MKPIDKELSDRLHAGLGIKPSGAVEPGHTPTPWYCTGFHVQSAVLNEDNYVCETEGNSHEQACTNAEFIVRACNAHAEMLEALQAIVDSENGSTLLDGGSILGAGLAEQARAAIAKAEGRAE